MTDHPITPPPELRRQWTQQYGNSEDPRWQAYEQDIATQAARWGADQELEACEKYWMTHGISPEGVARMREHRRPKPPSLKEQALAELELLRGDANAHGLGFDAPAIRRALEFLPD